MACGGGAVLADLETPGERAVFGLDVMTRVSP
jgi:hypothetical protein